MNFENEHLIRQQDIIPMNVLGERITIIGAGAIGGWTTLALAKMGFCNLTVMDFDIVDTVNMNAQFYRFKDIGKPKVMALAELVDEFTNVKIAAKNERYHGLPCQGIVIAAVDSMLVRKQIWDSHIVQPWGTRAIIDPRMGAEAALLYVMDPRDGQDREEYPKALYLDSEAVQERCTAKATIYTANLLSGLVVKAVKDILTKPNYLRVAQWDIANDTFLAFRKGEVPTIP
jgi:molybdopterin/thiamine biosynthesis adenylyltransferase